MEAWRRIHKDGEPHRVRFERFLIVYGLCDYLWLTWSTDHGLPWRTALGILAASQLPLLLVSWLWEYRAGHWWNIRQQARSLRRVVGKFNPKTQSWAFMADAFAFVPMGVFTATVLGSIHGKWFDTGWLGWLWLAVCLAGGALFSLSFRKGEGDVYDVLRYFSYSKLLHNGVAFTVLGGYILHSVIPVLIYGWHWGLWWKSLVVVISLLMWGVAAAADGERAGFPEGHSWRLDGRNLHPQVDARGHALAVEIAGVPTWSEHRNQRPEDAAWWTKVFHLRKPIAAWQGRGRHHRSLSHDARRAPGDESRRGYPVIISFLPGTRVPGFCLATDELP